MAQHKGRGDKNGDETVCVFIYQLNAICIAFKYRLNINYTVYWELSQKLLRP